MACLTSCPSGVQYDRLIEETRAYVEEHHKRSLFERAQRGMIFATVPYPRRLRRALAMTPPWLPGRLKPFAALKPPWRSSEQPPAVTPAEGVRRARVGLLLGCVQRVVFGDVNAATARVLAAEGCEVVAPRRPGVLRRAPPARGPGDGGAAPRGAARRGLRRRRRDRRQRGRLRVTSEGGRARRPGRRRQRAARRARPAREAERAADQGRLPGRLPPRACAGDPRRAALAAAHDPRPRAGRAGRASDLLRERRDLQPGSARGGRGARAAEGGERRQDRREGVRQRQPGLPRPGLEPPPQVGLAATRLAPGRAARRIDPRRLRRSPVRGRAPLTAAPEPFLDRLRERRRDVAVAANAGPVVRDAREPRSTEQDRKDPPRHAGSMRARRARPATSRRGGRCRRGSRGRARSGHPPGPRSPNGRTAWRARRGRRHRRW